MRTIPRVAPLLAMLLLTLMFAPPAQADHRQPYHWNRNHPTQTAVAQVYFVDHTGPNWPVYSMIAGPGTTVQPTIDRTTSTRVTATTTWSTAFRCAP